MNNKHDRIPAVDVVRGFALMGLFLVHMVEYFELYWYKQEPGWVHDTVFSVFSGKAYSIFALLFGLSFFILLERRGRSGNYTTGRFLWRMALLLAFGYLHSLLYAGDILQMLALGGFFLALIYRLPGFWLYVLAVLLLGQVITIFQYAVTLQNPGYAQPAFWELMGRNLEMFAHGAFSELVRYNAWSGQYPKWVFVVETGNLSNLLGLFIAGLLLGRAGFFERNHDAKPLLKYLAAAMACAGGFWLLRYAAIDYSPGLMPRWVFETVTTKYFNLALIAAYVLALLLLLKSPVFKRVLNLLAACGRMSLTLYVGQSLLFVPLFYGFGLGLYQSIGQLNALLLGLLAWPLQMAFANIWFRHYRYGPLEWLWRSLTRFDFDVPFRYADGIKNS
jgi:uncharacterized protein